LDIGQEQAVPLISQTKKYLAKEIRQMIPIIYDCPPGTSCPVIEATSDADFIILVTEPTPFGLHDLNLAVETMRVLRKKFAVVVNRFGVGDDSVINYCREQKIEIIATLPNYRRVAELYSTGTLIYKEIPEIKEELRKIKEYLPEL
jgi:MinD superfamily P-loop ATPase